MIPFRLPEVTPEMLAAGVEAWEAAHEDCLTKFQTVTEIFLAMYGIGHYLEPETFH